MPADWSILTSTNQLIPRFPKPNLLHHVAIQRRGFGIAAHRRRSHRRARGTSMGTACIGKDDYPWDGTWWHLYPNCTKQTRSWVNQMVFHLLISEQNLQHGRMVVFSRPQIMIDLWCPGGNYVSSYKKLLYILPFVMHPNDVYPWNKESWSIIIWWWLIVLLVVNLGNNHIDFSFETNITCRGTATGQAAYTCTFFFLRESIANIGNDFWPDVITWAIPYLQRFQRCLCCLPVPSIKCYQLIDLKYDDMWRSYLFKQNLDMSWRSSTKASGRSEALWDPVWLEPCFLFQRVTVHIKVLATRMMSQWPGVTPTIWYHWYIGI